MNDLYKKMNGRIEFVCVRLSELVRSLTRDVSGELRRSSDVRELYYTCCVHGAFRAAGAWAGADESNVGSHEAGEVGSVEDEEG